MRDLKMLTNLRGENIMVRGHTEKGEGNANARQERDKTSGGGEDELLR